MCLACHASALPTITTFSSPTHGALTNGGCVAGDLTASRLMMLLVAWQRRQCSSGVITPTRPTVRLVLLMLPSATDKHGRQLATPSHSGRASACRVNCCCVDVTYLPCNLPETVTANSHNRWPVALGLGSGDHACCCQVCQRTVQWTMTGWLQRLWSIIGRSITADCII